MSNDRVALLKFYIIAVLVIAGWFALVAASHNIAVRELLGSLGFGAVVALYFCWLKRSELRPPKK